MVAAPALAFNGARADYTPSDTCKGCHQNMASIPAVYDMWAETKHAEANADDQSTRLPYGSVCGGCHTGNYAPGKVVPTPTATSSTGAVTWVAGNVTPDTAHQADGNSAASELAVGCSSCHQSQTAAHAVGSANPSNLANPDICGQCHTRYSYTVATYSVAPVPYVSATPPARRCRTRTRPRSSSRRWPSASRRWVTRPAAGSRLRSTTNLNIPTPGWSPTPDPKATTAGFGRLQTYWTASTARVLPWAQVSHDGNAQQYSEWYGPADKHRFALENLKKVMGPNPPASCLECHSADYIIAEEDAKPTGAEAKYGISCVGCHTPHERGTAKGAWSDEFTPQLRYDNAKTLCTSCHNAELDGKIAKAGQHRPSSDEGDDGGRRRHRRHAGLPERPQGQVRRVPHAADHGQPRQRAARRQPHLQDHRA